MRREFGARLKAARLSASLSQSEVAVACQVSRQAVSAWERGAASPNVLDLRELGMLLGVSLDYLVYGIRTVPLSHYLVLRDVFREPAVEPC
jgi:transcriptional regulator with XRE-family HTH domain